LAAQAQAVKALQVEADEDHVKIVVGRPDQGVVRIFFDLDPVIRAEGG
jgi:hypothetical protein